MAALRLEIRTTGSTLVVTAAILLILVVVSASTPTGKAFCCYILTSDQWPTPYTGKTCDLTRRLHRHNHPSSRSRAYTKGKGPWRVAAAVFGLRSNRQSVWLERALKKHAKRRVCPAGLDATQSAVLDAVRVASRPSAWWPKKGKTRAARAAAASDPPTLDVHIFKGALAPRHSEQAQPDTNSWSDKIRVATAAADDSSSARVHCHHQRNYHS